LRNYRWLAWLIFLSSCVNQNNLVYLQTDTNQSYKNYETPEYKIRPLDILNIDLNNFSGSTIDFFKGDAGGNPQAIQGIAQGNPAFFYFKGYVVNDAGTIDLPIIGKLEVKGLTVSEIESIINEKLGEVLQKPSANVKLANFRVSVLGEVKRPGVQYVYDKQYTLLQALSQAGDLTDFGDRKKVRLVRKNEEESEIIILDLTRPDLISADYFFLQPNDVIYIQPVKAKAFSINSRVASLGLSILSILLVVVNITRN